MSPFALHFANGNSLFTGLAICCVACLLRLWRMPRAVQRVLAVAAVVGALLVVLSATPFPGWAYGVWGLCLAACLVTMECSRDAGTRYRRLAVACLVVLSASLGVAEWPHRRQVCLPFPKGKPLYVIGDSIAGGTETRVDPWPDVLAQLSRLKVTNLALGGNGVSGALDQAQALRGLDCSVLLEIGGNDILGDTTAAAFEQALHDLLAEVCQRGRVVAMFELPLPPFYNRFGSAQRRHARSFGVILIPKQCMAKVFGFPGATVDGLHLSAAGHRLMAELLSEMIDKSRRAR